MSNAANVQYREVARKAAAGERIRVVAIHPLSKKNGSVRIGDELTAASVDLSGAVWSAKERKFDGIIYADWNGLREYVVLEPVTTASPAAFPQESDALAANFRQFVLDNADAIRAILPQVETAFSVGTGGGATAKNVTIAQPKPLTRAEVIAKATADVAELLLIGRSIAASLPAGQFREKFYTAEFHVNRDKRTVVALVSTANISGHVLRKNVAKATAKAAPDDVFHAEIGKAIALRRALGLTVPDEYVNAPKPEKAQAGAVIRKVDGARIGKTSVIKRVLRAEYEFTNGVRAFIKNCALIDDTDVDYNAISAKEAA